MPIFLTLRLYHIFTKIYHVSVVNKRKMAGRTILPAIFLLTIINDTLINLLFQLFSFPALLLAHSLVLNDGDVPVTIF